MPRLSNTSAKTTSHWWQGIDVTAKLANLVLLAAITASMTGTMAEAQSSVTEQDKKIPALDMSSDLFTQFCVDNRDNITVLIDVFASEGYEWAPETKRFIHPTHDISFALLGSDSGFACFMEFANFYDPATSAAVFTKATSSRDVIVHIGFPEEQTDRNYVWASLSVEATLTE